MQEVWGKKGHVSQVTHKCVQGGNVKVNGRSGKMKGTRVHKGKNMRYGKE